MLPKKTIIFDVDGTLFSSIAVILHCFQETFEILQEKFPGNEEIKKFIGCGLNVIFMNFLSKEKIEKAINIYREKYLALQRKGLSNEGVNIIPGVLEILQNLHQKKFNIGAFTMKSHDATIELFKLAHINQYFSIIVGFENVKNSKPDPEGLFKCQEFFASKKEEMLFVGDSLHDGECSRKAGIDFAAVLTGTTSKDSFQKAGFKNILKSVKDLLNFLS